MKHTQFFFLRFTNKELQIYCVHAYNQNRCVCVCLCVNIMYILVCFCTHTHTHTCMHFSSSPITINLIIPTTKRDMQMFVIEELSMWLNRHLIIMSNKYNIIHIDWPYLLCMWYIPFTLFALCLRDWNFFFVFRASSAVHQIGFSINFFKWLNRKF